MDTARDLANAALWQKSLERSLARRGKQTRSSLELYRLRPERDLVYGDFIRESALYSQMRRSARSRPSMALPTAGGISALALLAATTIPSLLDGNGGAGHERVAYRADRSAARLRRATAHAAVADACVAAPNSAAPSVGAIEGVGAMPSRNAVSTTGAIASNGAQAKAGASSTRSSGSPAPHGHITLARDASAGRDVSGGVVARVASGGAAPARPGISAAPPRVPAAPSPPRHPSTGGGAVQERSAIRAIRSVH